MSLKNKLILITAGPTWVSIDSVRVISNTASGETGVILARKLQRLGAKVTLFLGPGGGVRLSQKIKLVRFRFFKELLSLIKKELRSAKYDMVIHSAAVSDYQPRNPFLYKVGSGKKTWKIDLAPTPKIIDEIKKISPGLFLVGFKFETGSNLKQLIEKAAALGNRSGADLLVANTIKGNRYKACLVSRGWRSRFYNSKIEMSGGLIKKLGFNAKI